MRHDDGCPVLGGAVSVRHAGLRAAQAAARDGASLTYIATETS